MGIPVLTPSPYTPHGVDESAVPVESGLVIYDFGDAPGDQRAAAGERGALEHPEQAEDDR